MQKVMLIGRLGNDPEKKMIETRKGKASVTTFRLASNIYVKGERETLWWGVSVWGSDCASLLAVVKKGSQVMVYGDLQTPRIYQSSTGENQVSLYVTARDISFVGGTGGSNTVESESSGGEALAVAGHSGQGASGLSSSSLDDDEIPF